MNKKIPEFIKILSELYFPLLGVGIGLVVLVIPDVIIWIWQIVDAYND